MTQELVLLVLVTGLVGLIWVMTVSILSDDQSSTRDQATRTSSGHDAPHHDSELKRRTMTA